MSRASASFAGRPSAQSSFCGSETSKLKEVFDRLDTKRTGEVCRDDLADELRQPSVRSSIAGTGPVPALPLEMLISRVGTWTSAATAGHNATGITWQELEAHARDTIGAASPGPDSLQIGSYQLAVTGLSQEQLATLQSFAGELSDINQDRERLLDALKRAELEAEGARTLIAERDECIRELLAGEAADVQAFKDRQQQEIEALKRKVEELSAEASAGEAARKHAELRLSEQASRTAMLSMQLSEARDQQGRSGDDHKQRADSALEDAAAARRKHGEVERALAAAHQQHSLTDSARREAEAEVRDAKHRIEQLEKDVTESQDKLREFRRTISEQMERHQQALDDAEAELKRTLSQLQQERAEMRSVRGQLRDAEMLADEKKLECGRLADDLSRLRAELAATRKVEGMLRIDIKQLQIVKQERDSSLAQTRIQLQEDHHTLDEERKQLASTLDEERRQMETLAGVVEQQSQLLRRMNDDMHELVHGERPESSDSGPAALPAEIDRVSQLRDQVGALLESRQCEQREREDRDAASMKEVSDQLAAEKRRSALLEQSAAVADTETAARADAADAEAVSRYRVLAARALDFAARCGASWPLVVSESSARQHLAVTQGWSMAAAAMAVCHSGAIASGERRQLEAEEVVGRRAVSGTESSAAREMAAWLARAFFAATQLGKIQPEEALERAGIGSDEASGFSAIRSLAAAGKEYAAEGVRRAAEQRRLQLQQYGRSEEDARGRVLTDEQGRRAAMQAKRRADRTELEENGARAQVEDFEATDFGMLGMAFDAALGAANEAERLRREREVRLQKQREQQQRELLQQQQQQPQQRSRDIGSVKQPPKRRETVYLGLEVSEGIVVGRTQDFAGDHINKAGEAESVEGVKVFAVTPGGPADGAGLQPGDVIVQFNGVEVRSLQDFRGCVAGTRPGDGVTLALHEGGVGQRFFVTLQTERVAEDDWEPGRQRTIGYRVPVLTRFQRLTADRARREQSHRDQQKRLAQQLSARREAPQMGSLVDRSASPPHRNGVSSVMHRTQRSPTSVTASTRKAPTSVGRAGYSRAGLTDL